MIAKRMDTLYPSLTITISNLAKELKASGRDILSFSAGEPDFGTPQVIKDEALKAMNINETGYTAVAGTPEIRQAVANKLKRDNGLEYSANQIIISNGAKHSLFNLFQALVNEGDEVIIPSPYWVTYPELVKYSGGVPITIETTDESGFKITASQLKSAITDKTKILVLTTPSNPTGSVYSEDEIKALAKVLEGTEILIISDEMYEKLIYDGLEFTAVASVSDDMFKRTITVNGLSKSVAMTGWRFGYLATVHDELIKNMIKLQGQSTSNVNSITQYASVAGLDGRADDDIEMMRVEFEKRRNFACDEFNKIDGLSVVKPNGAFYLFVNIKKITNDSMSFCTNMLEETGVAVVPGVGFGSEGYFRFSFATDLETIKEGINRIKEFVAKQ
jgi:aspartate aminotransferase